MFEDSFDEDDGEDAADRWLHVWPTGSRRAYDDMVDFTATRPDQRLRERLDRALDGRGAFRRFKDVVFAWPGDREDWLVFAEDHRRGRGEWTGARMLAADLTSPGNLSCRPMRRKPSWKAIAIAVTSVGRASSARENSRMYGAWLSLPAVDSGSSPVADQGLVNLDVPLAHAFA